MVGTGLVSGRGGGVANHMQVCERVFGRLV